MSAQPRPAEPPRAPGDPTDAESVAAVVAGDREAYRALVQRHQESLFHYALGMVGGADAAADLAQEAFIRAYTSLDRCRTPEQFGAWIHRILRNKCLDYLKDRRRAVVPLYAVAEMESGVEAVDRALEQEDVRTVVFAALATLPDDQREAFLLKHLEERSYEEMAEVLGASVSALKMRVKRARDALQLRLGDRGL